MMFSPQDLDWFRRVTLSGPCVPDELLDEALQAMVRRAKRGWWARFKDSLVAEEPVYAPQPAGRPTVGFHAARYQEGK